MLGATKLQSFIITDESQLSGISMPPGIQVSKLHLPVNSSRRLQDLFCRKYRNNSAYMEEDLTAMKTDARNIFKAGVKAVLPQCLIDRWLRLKDDRRLLIGERVYDVSDNVYLVGFGKAVTGMTRAVQDALGHHLVKGVISVPLGTVELMENTGRKETLPVSDGKIILNEGAKDNLPDEPALQSACDIVSLVSNLTHHDILITLISGGGSALLPSPILPVTLEEKQMVIKRLSAKGATIQELNSVRKRLSRVKGGGLAKLAHPAQVVALMLSDIVGDPIDLIASGPTVRNVDSVDLPLQILEKYDLLQDVPESVLGILKELKVDDGDQSDRFSHVYNLLIGTNSLAIESALNEANILGYHAIALTSQLTGVARDVGKTLSKLAAALINKDIETLKECERNLRVPYGSLDHLVLSGSKNQRLCVVCGGETVVLVKGQGLGGRNQEMALAAAITLSSEGLADRVVFLSAGTDGIDGPTPAAGALGYGTVISRAAQKGMEPCKYLDDNNSYGFYLNLDDGADLVLTGHTGTNVMDLQVMLIQLS